MSETHELAHALAELRPAQRFSWPAPGEALEHEELRAAVDRALETLSPRAAEVLRLRFGFDTDDELTLKQAGEAVIREDGAGPTSKERVRQIEAKALRMLRHRTRSPALREHLGLGPLLTVQERTEADLPFWEREKLEAARAAERRRLEEARAERSRLEAEQQRRQREEATARRRALEAGIADEKRRLERERTDAERARIARSGRSWWICSKEGIECARCGDPVRRGEVYAVANDSGESLHRGCADELGPSLRVFKKFELRERAVRLPSAAEAVAKYEPLTSPHVVQLAARSLIGDELQEVFLVFLLDVRNEVLGYIEAARGGVDACPVDPRVVFRAAVAAGASAIIVAHNHPSGRAEPSAEDVALTARLKEAGELLGIRLLDHVIVTPGLHFSLAEAGMMLLGRRST